MLPKEDRDLIKMAGRYTYYKMKDLGLPITIEAYNKYLDEKAKERRLKKKMGYTNFNKMKELGLNYQEYKQYQKEQKLKKYERKREKDKIRFRTIRYIERYCNLEMKCQICNTLKDIQIHHPNYNDYLKINLLCKKHHNQLHNFELIPPIIIDLEEIATREPPMKGKKEFIEGQIENMKLDILDNGLSYRELNEKYNVDRQTIKRYLEKEDNWENMKNKLEEAGKKFSYIGKLKYKDNPIQKYRMEHNLTTREFSSISQIPVPTIRTLEQGKTDFKKVKLTTKKKLEKLGIAV